MYKLIRCENKRKIQHSFARKETNRSIGTKFKHKWHLKERYDGTERRVKEKKNTEQRRFFECAFQI